MSTATTSLRLIKQGQSDTGWGVLLNSGVMDVVDLAVAGTANISTTGGSTTLDNVDYVADNGKAAILNVTGALASNATIVIPNASKTYIVVNGTTNAFSLTIKTSAGSGITIPQGYTQKVRCDGSNVTAYASGAVVGSTGAIGVPSLTPLTNDGGALGSTSLQFSDLFLAEGGVINWDNGDVTITQTGNVLAFAGASTGYTFDALLTGTAAGNAARFINSTDAASNQGIRIESDRATPANNDIIYASFYLSDSVGTQTEAGRISTRMTVVTDASETSQMLWATLSSGTLADRIGLQASALFPVTDNAVALGAAGFTWADILLGSGAVINIAASDWVATHSTGILTVGTGDLRVTNAGTNAASVATLSGAQTLANKSIDLTSNTLVGSVSEFNAALESADFYTTGGTNVAEADGGTGSDAFATTSEYLANTASKVLATDDVWAAGALTALTDQASIAVDMSTGINFSVTLGDNRTLANPTNTKVGQSGAIVVTQDGTGSRTLAYDTNWEFESAAAPVLTTTASAKDILFYWVQSSTSIVITGILRAVA